MEKEIEVTNFKHYSGECKLFLGYDDDHEEFVLCAVGYNESGENVEQIDLDAYSKEDIKKIIKKMKKFVKENS